jgi:glutamyl-tRNA synthetase
MIKNPAGIKVRGLPKTITMQNHPTKDMGARTIELDEGLYVEQDDLKNAREGDQIRLIGLGNVRLTKQQPHAEAEFAGDEMVPNIAKIHWVVQKTAQKIKILIPSQLFFGEQFNEKSLEEINVFSEPYYLELKEGKEIQFVRFGYCRKDSMLQAIYTHK